MQVALRVIRLESLMAKKKNHLKNTAVVAPTGRKKKEKQPTQVDDYIMMMVMGPTGKLRMEKQYK